MISRCILESVQNNIISFSHDQACGDYLVRERPLQRFYSVVFIGLPFFVIPMPTFQLMRDVRSWKHLKKKHATLKPYSDC